MKRNYLLIFIYEDAMQMFDLYIMSILVLKSIILVLCQCLSKNAIRATHLVES